MIGIGRDARGRQRVNLVDEHGRTIQWDPRLGRASQIDVFKEEQRDLAAGDRIQWRLVSKEDYWPNERACPDWPMLGKGQVYSGRTGKAGAEERLEALGRYLNRGSISLHVPTADERSAEFARVFKRRGTKWYSFGIVDLSPLGMMTEDEAGMMIEACHIRGYLRKLEAASIRDAEAAEQRKQAEARRTLEDCRHACAYRQWRATEDRSCWRSAYARRRGLAGG